MRVAVGSLNPVKVEAARLVFERFFGEVEIQPVEVETSIPAQPIGIDQVIKGAVERAYQALSSVTGWVGGRPNTLSMDDHRIPKPSSLCLSRL